jgi:hypothetical protein
MGRPAINLSLEFKRPLLRISPIHADYQKKSVKIRVTPHWRAAQVFAAKTALYWRLKKH